MQSFSDALDLKLRDGAWTHSLPVAIYSCDRDGRIWQYNRRAAELWGQEPPLGDSDQRFCGSYRLRRLDGTELPHAETPMAQVLRSGQPVRGQTVEIVRPDGSSVMVQVSIDPITGDDGEVLGAVNCFHDVTELHRSRQAAAEEKGRLQILLEALPAAVYMTDPDGAITFFNDAAVVLAGRRPVAGDRWCVSWRLRSPDGAEMAHSECPMAIALTERRPLRGEQAIAERPDGTRVPFLAYPTPIFGDDGSLAGAINMLVDISEHKKAADDQRLLINELNHRVKNTLATVQSIARQTLRRSRRPEDFVTSVLGRIDSLAAAHTILTERNWRGAELRELAARQLALDPGQAGRVVLNGPAVALPAQTALHLALLLHELGTNARKYGALSAAQGRVEVSWQVERTPSRALHLIWRESGGPRVTKPESRGFGSTLIERSLQAEAGTATLHYAAEGLSCTVRVPLPDRAPSLGVERPTGVAAGTANGGPDPAGWRILVVEDEPLIATDIEAMLSEAGCTVVGPAQDHDTALGLARSARIDLAVLDANLAGRPVDEIAAELTRRGIPFMFASGYGREGLPPAFREARVLTKPFDEQQLASALGALTQVDGKVHRMRPRTGGAG